MAFHRSRACLDCGHLDEVIVWSTILSRFIGVSYDENPVNV